MSYRPANELLAESDARGLRRALFVTAIELEMDAVRAYLTEPCSVVGRDGTIFECGVFSEGGQDWLVVVAETGPGTHPAQGVVTNAHVLLGEFEVQILVGIGGSRKADAPIGSVVASEHVYMPYSGKAGDNGWSARPRGFQVDARLAGLAKKVRRDRAWPNRIKNPLNGALPNATAYPVDMPPKALVAPIASIEAVLANRESPLEQLIARECGDACVVEMEGYGAVYAAAAERTPSIVIRGVSDMAEKKEAETDKTLQPIAACHAAAFGFEMLAEWAQIYPPLMKVVPPALSAQAAEPPVEPDKAPSRVVLNLDLDPASATPERIAELQAALRKVAGAEDLKIVATEEGSVRLVIEDPTGALSELDLAKLRDQLHTEEGVPLLGRVEEGEYRELPAVQAELRRASNDLMSWPTSLPDGEWIDRPELANLLEVIKRQERSTIALLGAPGSGKSALLATLCGIVANDLKWPLLAIKADLVPTDVASEGDLARYLDLSDRPSRLLERMAKLRPVVLVIDQLDALAAYLDLRTGRLNVLMNLVRRLGEIDNVHIVLSSRTFEFEHDVRLKTIQAQDIRLELPAWSKVQSILENHGVAAAGWPDDAQEVMRSPQALATYLGLDTSGGEVFRTYQSMLERLWAKRVTGGERGLERSQLVSDLAEQMAAEETLWLPRVRFENRDADLTALTSAGIVTPLGGEGSIGFTHQTLFDHALARSFARTNGRLSQYVLERQTSLFLRPKLWAALTYMRSVDPASYGAEIEAIWTAQGLRTHLRLLLIDFIGQQAAPTDREALLLDRALQDPTTRAITFKAVTGSQGWFERLAGNRIGEAMAADPDLVLGLLTSAWSFGKDRIVDLIAEQWIDDPANDARAWMVLQNAPEWSEAALALAKVIVDRSNIAPFAIDYVVSILGVAQPIVALELVKAQLDRTLRDAKVEAAAQAATTKPDQPTDDDEATWGTSKGPRESLERLLEGSNDWDSLAALAETWPAEYLAVLWPWFCELFGAIKAHSGPREGYLGYALGLDGDFRFDGENNLGLPEPALLGSARIAVEQLAAQDPDAFLAWVAAQNDVDAAPVHRLIAHVFTLQAETLSKAAVGYLLEDERRWYLGSIHGLISTTTRLIEAAAPYWSDADVESFEAAVRAYDPPAPPGYDDARSRRSWRHTVRRMKLGLLRALPKTRASAETRRTIEEESRAFPDAHMGARFSGAGWIGSRMDATAMAKASDQDVLNAFKTLPDATGWHHPNDWMSGGNIQLAREFANFAKTDAERAVRLIDQFEPEFGTRGAGYALDAIGETADPKVVADLFVSLASRGFDGEEFRSSASHAVERLVSRKAPIGPEIIAILEGWLKAPLGPQPDEDGNLVVEDEEIDTAADESEQGKADPETGSLLWGYGGISILPGGDYPILSALLRARLVRREFDELIDILNLVLDRSSSPRLWEGILHLAVYLQPGTTDRRPELIGKIFDRVPSLVTSKAGVHLLAYVQWWSSSLVEAQLARKEWLATPTTRQAYGELIGLVAIVQPGLNWAAERLAAIVTDEAQTEARTGAAMSAANLWSDIKHRPAATRLLTELIARQEPGVWAAVFDLFRLVEELTPDADTVRLLGAMAAHIESAPPLSATFVVERLQTLLPHQASLVGSVALGLIEIWRGQLNDMRTSHALAAPELVDLAVTLHRLGPETRELGTQLFEELIHMDAYSARETLDQIDARFRNTRGTTRPRLARRRTRAGRRR